MSVSVCVCSQPALLYVCFPLFHCHLSFRTCMPTDSLIRVYLSPPACLAVVLSPPTHSYHYIIHVATSVCSPPSLSH